MIVTRELTRVTLKLTKDVRLVAAVSGAAAYFAGRAGLERHDQEEFIRGIEEACRETLPLLSPKGATLQVTIEDFADRIEAILEHRGAPLSLAKLGVLPNAGAGTEAGQSGPGLLGRVDRIKTRSRGKFSQTILVKYLPAQPELK